MQYLTQISKASLPIALLLLSSLCTHARIKHSNKEKTKNTTTISLKSGESLSLNSNNFAQDSKINKKNTGVYVQKKLNAHLSVEAGYLQQKDCSTQINNQGKYKILSNNQFQIPITLQYYVLPTKSKLQPYYGTGIVYNPENQNKSQYTKNDITKVENNDNSGHKTISIVFTQGISYEVNTKIQINQSFHFITGNQNQTFGFDLGIGYKFP